MDYTSLNAWFEPEGKNKVLKTVTANNYKYSIYLYLPTSIYITLSQSISMCVHLYLRKAVGGWIRRGRSRKEQEGVKGASKRSEQKEPAKGRPYIIP